MHGVMESWGDARSHKKDVLSFSFSFQYSSTPVGDLLGKGGDL